MNAAQRDQLLRPKFGGPLVPIPEPGPVEVVILAGTDKIGTVELVSFTGLTDGQLRAAPLEVTVLTMPEITIPPLAFPATLAVTGPLTDAELRAAALPISAAVLPLPAGAATDVKQDTGNASLASLDGKAPALVSGRVPVDGSAVTQPVSAATLPLPTGAATSAKQDTGNTSLASIDGKAPALVAGRVPVDGSAVTQPVSAATLPLPTGAATSAKQDTANTSLASIDGKAPALVSGRVPVDGSAVTQPVSAATLPLPTGAATSAKQDTGNASLASIDSKLTGPISVKELRPSTATASPVADSATSTTILASNANRLGATVFNDSSSTLYLLLGSGAASTTNYTVQLAQNDYYEVPCGYTGQLTGIWATDPNNGAARVTELT